MNNKYKHMWKGKKETVSKGNY